MIPLVVDEQRYGRLLARARPSIIRSEEENERILGQIEALMDKGDRCSPEEDRLLELLAKLAADFEAIHYDLGESKPNEVLTYLMEQKSMRQTEIADLLGCSRGAMSDMISGRREISRANARKLAEFFRVSVDLFI